MGALRYGHTEQSFTMDDRALAHLQIVVVAKLRRGEGFAFVCEGEVGDPTRRTALWMAPAIPIRFDYDDPNPPEINRHWLDRLSAAASSIHGLRMCPEPESSRSPVLAR